MPYSKDRGKLNWLGFINNATNDATIPKDIIIKLITWIFLVDPPNMNRNIRLKAPVSNIEIR